MKIVDLPEMKISKYNIENISEWILDFYKKLGWNGKDNLNIKKVKINPKDYKRIVEELQSVATEESDRKRILYLWSNYAPSVDEHIKVGRIGICVGFITT